MPLTKKESKQIVALGECEKCGVAGLFTFAPGLKASMVCEDGCDPDDLQQD